MQGLNGKGTGIELDGGEVQHGEKAGVSGITTEGAEKEGAAAGGGVGFEDGVGMEESLEGGAGGLSTDGDLDHVDHRDAKLDSVWVASLVHVGTNAAPGAVVRESRGAAGTHRTGH